MPNTNIYRSYFGKCDFNVGMLFSHDAYAFALYEACKKIGIEYPIDYVFGSTPCLFQGGRAAPNNYRHAEIEQYIERYANMHVGCRLTFSNYELTEDDLVDEESNYLLALLNSGENNGVILSSDLLAEYVRKTYPNLQLISSLVKPTVENTLGEETVDYYNKLFDTYDIVVVNSAKANDDAYLAGIAHPDRVEFIANHRCRPNCRRSHEHYMTQTRAAQAATTGNRIAQRQLEHKLTQINDWCAECRAANPAEAFNLISAKRIEELVSKGFKHYKIEGRDYPMPVVVRDIGTWIFEPEGPYLSIAQGLLKSPI